MPGAIWKQVNIIVRKSERKSERPEVRKVRKKNDGSAFRLADYLAGDNIVNLTPVFCQPISGMDIQCSTEDST